MRQVCARYKKIHRQSCRIPGLTWKLSEVGVSFLRICKRGLGMQGHVRATYTPDAPNLGRLLLLEMLRVCARHKKSSIHHSPPPFSERSLQKIRIISLGVCAGGMRRIYIYAKNASFFSNLWGVCARLCATRFYAFQRHVMRHPIKIVIP